MRPHASLFLLWALAGLAQADDGGMSAGQSAKLARATAYAYSIQPPRDVYQIRQGNGHSPGEGTAMNLTIGPTLGGGLGHGLRDSIVNVRDVFQLCLDC
jgi:hypothetical protein